VTTVISPSTIVAAGVAALCFTGAAAYAVTQVSAIVTRKMASMFRAMFIFIPLFPLAWKNYVRIGNINPISIFDVRHSRIE
jgi:hypothetical protein